MSAVTALVSMSIKDFHDKLHEMFSEDTLEDFRELRQTFIAAIVQNAVPKGLCCKTFSKRKITTKLLLYVTFCVIL